MTQASNPFYNGKFATVTGIGGNTEAGLLTQELSVEYLAADPADLSIGAPRIWVNTATGTLKFTFTTSGVPTKTVTAT